MQHLAASLHKQCLGLAQHGRMFVLLSKTDGGCAGQHCCERSLEVQATHAEELCACNTGLG